MKLNCCQAGITSILLPLYHTTNIWESALCCMLEIIHVKCPGRAGAGGGQKPSAAPRCTPHLGPAAGASAPRHRPVDPRVSAAPRGRAAAAGDTRHQQQLRLSATAEWEGCVTWSLTVTISTSLLYVAPDSTQRYVDSRHTTSLQPKISRYQDGHTLVQSHLLQAETGRRQQPRISATKPTKTGMFNCFSVEIFFWGH